jgi:hypothetical protein
MGPLRGPWHAIKFVRLPVFVGEEHQRGVFILSTGVARALLLDSLHNTWCSSPTNLKSAGRSHPKFAVASFISALLRPGPRSGPILIAVQTDAQYFPAQKRECI